MTVRRTSFLEAIRELREIARSNHIHQQPIPGTPGTTLNHVAKMNTIW